jgi:hypothetical protein
LTDFRQLKTLAEDPGAVRALARQLLTVGSSSDSSWTDWELDFLDSMAQRESEEPLSMRQREVLGELKNAAERRSTVDGLNVRLLIERCWMERADLEADEDQAFIEDLKGTGQRSVTRRQLGRLLRCCRELGVLEGEYGIAG